MCGISFLAKCTGITAFYRAFHRAVVNMQFNSSVSFVGSADGAGGGGGAGGARGACGAGASDAGEEE